MPTTLAIIVAARIVGRLLPAHGVKPLIVAGTVVAAAGPFGLIAVDQSGAYLPVLLLPELVLGTALGLVFVPLTAAATTASTRPTPTLPAER